MTGIVKTAAAIAALGMALTAPGAFAGPWGDEIDARQWRQQERIVEGVRSGQLTEREAARLWAQQREIRGLERAFRADGWLDWRERRILERELDRASFDIRREKHDGWTRWNDRSPQRPGAWIDERQYNQREHIRDGWRSGELSADEAWALREQQREIRSEERVARGDGRLTPPERERLNEQLDRASRDIERARRDGERR